MNRLANNSVISICTGLAILLMLGSCGDTASAPADTGSAETNASETEATETEADVLAYLPDTDMDGWEMEVLCHQDSRSGLDTFTTDELNGEVLNDAIFNRNKRIEERYNMNLNIFAVGDQWETVKNALQKSVTAGDDAYDMVIFYDYAMTDSIVSSSLFYNMLDIPYIDFSNPWWHSDINETYTLFNYLPCVLSDFSVNSYQYANLLVFNKVMAQNLDITNLYDLVREHKWTLDTFYEIVKNVSADSNGDGKMDENDTYGYSTNFSYHIITYGYAIGEKGVTLTENGVELGYKSEKFANLTSWLYNLLYSGNHYAYEIGWDKECDISWDENRVLFEAIWLIELERFRDYESSYGLLPYPMYDENQEMYYTYDDARSAAFGIPMTSGEEDRAKTGLILEALSADSYYNVIPQYLESVVDSKYSRDEDSLEMLDYIMAGRVRDIGYAIPDNHNYSWVLYNDLKKSGGSLASTLEKYTSATTKYYNKIIAKYQELGEMDW